MEEILKEIHTYCGNECCSVNNCPEEACVLYRIEKRILELTQNKGSMSLVRAKKLITNFIKDRFERHLSGEDIPTSEVINYLFLLDFTEEELIGEFGFSEDDIDEANSLLE